MDYNNSWNTGLLPTLIHSNKEARCKPKIFSLLGLLNMSAVCIILFYYIQDVLL